MATKEECDTLKEALALASKILPSYKLETLKLGVKQARVENEGIKEQLKTIVSCIYDFLAYGN